MEKIKIPAKSWHYRLATVYGRHWGTFDDSCEYGHFVLRGILTVALIIIISSMTIGYATVHVTSAAVVWYQMGYIDEVLVKAAQFIAILASVAVFGAVIFKLCDMIPEWLDRRYERKMRQLHESWRTPPKPPSTLKQLYRAFEEKYCVPVQIIYENKSEGTVLKDYDSL